VNAEDAATHAAHVRLRPILMTSLAFIAGVAPLAIASGAGSEMRQSLGTTVFFGMLGVTIFGLAFTPAFYAFVRKLGIRHARHARHARALPAKLSSGEAK
jgi:multidrug efflux pump subunit AcrB